MKTEIIQLEDTTLEFMSVGKKKRVFSLSGATDENHSFLYFGVHGSSEKLELCDVDLESLEIIIKELKDARSQSSQKRVGNDRGQRSGNSS